VRRVDAPPGGLRRRGHGAEARVGRSGVAAGALAPPPQLRASAAHRTSPSSGRSTGRCAKRQPGVARVRQSHAPQPDQAARQSAQKHI